MSGPIDRLRAALADAADATATVSTDDLAVILNAHDAAMQMFGLGQGHRPVCGGTQGEHRVLRRLIEAPEGAFVPHRDIAAASARLGDISDRGDAEIANLAAVMIRRLRVRLAHRLCLPVVIETSRGAGYRLTPAAAQSLRMLEIGR